MRVCSFISSGRLRSPWPITSNSCWKLPAPMPEVEPAAGDPRHRGDAVGHVDRVAERDDRRRPEADPLGHAGQVRQGHERLDERPVGAFHAVRMEDEVVADPERVEARAGRPGGRPRSAGPGRPPPRSAGRAGRNGWPWTRSSLRSVRRGRSAVGSGLAAPAGLGRRPVRRRRRPRPRTSVVSTAPRTRRPAYGVQPILLRTISSRISNSARGRRSRCRRRRRPRGGPCRPGRRRGPGRSRSASTTRSRLRSGRGAPRRGSSGT